MFHDDGLPWSFPQMVLARQSVHLGEPDFVRSPDGRKIAVLLHKDSRRKFPHVTCSRDECRTWTEPKNCPLCLPVIATTANTRRMAGSSLLSTIKLSELDARAAAGK